MPYLCRILLGCCLLACQSPAGAQEAPAGAPARPRIGLVLSGGGARGAAHVGVLKVLDELHVPVDAIAGTSMGAVVGGLYASGLTGREIETIISGVDWQDAFRDRPRRSDLNLRRKREDQDYLVQLPLGLRDGRFLLPRGLIQGQKLGLLLRELTLRTADVPDFDHLPTPFRAVATDLETGKPVILGNGDLATAIRASVSAPGIFTPVERDGRLLVDGGIAENLPIDVARAMNVDVLIVVDVGFPLATRDKLGSVASISNQMLAILIRRDSERQRATLDARDITVDPDLGDASSFDFTRLASAIELGEQAARAGAGRLAALALPPAEHERYLARRHAREAPAPVLSFVRPEPGSESYAAAIEALLGGFVGQRLDTTRLARRINQYYGQGTLEALDYRLVPQDAALPDGAQGLLVRARRNSWGPNYVRFGLRLQDDFNGNSTFDAASRFVFTELNAQGAEWSWDLQVGANPKLATELFLPFTQGPRYFLSPHAAFSVRNVPQIVNEEQVGALRVRSSRFGLDLGRELGSSGELRLGIEREVGSSYVRLGDTSEPRVDFRTREYFGRYSYDSIDSAAFPRSGGSVTLEWRGVLRDQSADRISDSLRMDWRKAWSYGRNSAILWASAGTMMSPSLANERSYFPLGGFLNLSGLTPDALRAPNYAITRLIYFRKVGSGGEGFLNVPLYAGMSLEAGNAWTSRREVSFGSARKDASLFFGLDTFLGPAYVAAGYDDRGRSAFYLFLGRGF
jgi:NTE family protein